MLDRGRHQTVRNLKLELRFLGSVMSDEKFRREVRNGICKLNLSTAR